VVVVSVPVADPQPFATADAAEAEPGTTIVVEDESPQNISDDDASWTPDLPDLASVADAPDASEIEASEIEDGEAPEVREAPETNDAPGDGHRNADGSPVDDIFARLRAQRVEAVATARVVLADEHGELSPAAVAVREVIDVTDAGSAVGPAETAGDPDVFDVTESEPATTVESSQLAVRRAELGLIEKTLARHLKRALADEQNDVFDRLRRTAHTPAADVVFGSEIDHLDRYRAAVEADVRSAATAGARRGGASPLDSSAVIDRARVVEAVLAEVAIDVAGPMRARLLDSLAQAGQDCEEATSLLRAAYREWKTQRFDDLASHIVISAYERGLVAAVPAGTCMRWMIDPSGAPCPDAEDNALAGPVPAGEPFPTGHVVPPAHVGCRCHLVVD
jgi:hypothetical protein